MVESGNAEVAELGKLDRLTLQESPSTCIDDMGDQDVLDRPHKAFEYGPLGGPKLIRLLSLHPGGEADPLSGSLLHIRADETVYESISYCWGNPEKSFCIDLDGRLLAITQSLSCALRRLRLPDQNRLIWADAICINQADLDEKARQLVLMPEIYMSASKVLVYLGEPTGDSDLALELVVKIAQADLRALSTIVVSPEALKTAGLPPRDDRAWHAVRKFWTRPWFSRIWVVQETILSRDIVFICGQSEIGWKPLIAGTEKLNKLSLLGSNVTSKLEPIEHLEAEMAATNMCMMLKYRSQRRSGTVLTEMLRSFTDSHEGWMETVESLEAPPILKWMFQYYRDNPELLPELESLLTSQLGASHDQLLPSTVGVLALTRTFAQSESTDPRDRIYALIGISNDITPENFPPSYEEAPEETARRFTRLLVEIGQGIDVLYHAYMRPPKAMHSGAPESLLDQGDCRPRTRILLGAPEDDVENLLPSWMTNWTRHGFSNAAFINAGGIYGLYHAATAVDPQLSLEPGDVLRISGYRVGEFSRLGEVGVSPDWTTWPPFIEEVDAIVSNDDDPYFSGEPWPEVQWRLLCGNTNLHPAAAPADFASQYTDFRDCVRGLHPTGSWTTPADEVALHRLLTESMWFKSFTSKMGLFKLAKTREGFVGLVPKAAAVTDELFIVKGARTPFVLRPRQGNANYQLVGACYIHGMMEGESLSMGFEEVEMLVA